MSQKALTPALVVLWLFAGAGVAHATSGADIIGYLNAQRAANGLPAGITENPTWSDACAKHNAYGAQNGTLAHSEDASKPGYTPEGNDIAGQSVLYQGETWTASNNPFEFAPIHLSQVLQPRLDVMGAAEGGGYGCATTFPSRNRPDPPADVVYTYPGDGTTIGYASETAVEGPYTPGEALGLAHGAKTGTYLFAFPDGPGITPNSKAQATCAQLVGPDGAVDLLYADNTHPKLAGFLPPEVVIIPRNPLAPSGTYAVSVAGIMTPAGGAARAFVKNWTFKTGSGGAAPASTPTCPTPDPGTTPAGGGGGSTSGSHGTAGSARKLLIALPSGTGLSQLTVGIDPAAKGHGAKLRVRLMRKKCTGKGKKRHCAFHQFGRSKTTQIKSLGSKLTVRLPRRPRGMVAEIRLSIPAFRASDGTRFHTTTVVKRFS